MHADLSAEIRQDVERAARAWAELDAAGREIHFELAGPGDALAATLRDRDGRVLCELTPFQILQASAGVPVSVGSRVLRS